MKKLLSTFLLCVLALSCIGCGTKKVESKYHFGYNLDYVKDEFDLSGFELLADEEDVCSFRKEEIETFSFSMIDNSEYINYIAISSNSQKDAAKYFEYCVELLDIFDEDAKKDLSDTIQHTDTTFREDVGDYTASMVCPDEYSPYYIVEIRPTK